jgi:hypothetical protein
MKKCDYCGGVNDDTVAQCRECGSSAFGTGARQKPATAPRAPEPDEVPLPAIAKREGNFVILKCRTPDEAHLVSEELEKEDIIAPLPNDAELLADFERKGYVELQVSARAYKSEAVLRAIVEFQYKRTRGQQPLSWAGKAVGVTCGFVIVPGLLIFIWLLSSYQKNGYHRMAKELKLCYFIGVASWLLLMCGLAILT